MMTCTCLSLPHKVRLIVFSDLALALVHTIYKVSSSSVLLKQVFDVENGQKGSNYDELSLEQLTLKKFSTVFIITTSVMGLALEMFLFFLLNNGVRSKNYRHCKHWFIIRTLLLLLSVIGSVIEEIRGEYTLLDAILEVEKFYRILTLIIVRNFMVEIHKGVSDNNFEYNSSNLDVYIPNGVPSIQIRSHSHSHISQVIT